MRRAVPILITGIILLFSTAALAGMGPGARAIAPRQNGTGVLTGIAWVDIDEDGSVDAEEPRVAWVLVTLDGPGSFYQEQYTDQDGQYQFVGLEGGYLLDAVPPGGYELVNPGPWIVQVQSGQTLTVNIPLRQIGTPAPTPTPTPTPTVTPTATPTPFWDPSRIETAYCQGVYLDTTSTGVSQASAYSCVPYWPETGPERIYVLHSAASQPITVTLAYDSSLTDLDVFLLSAPDPMQCVAYGDRSAAVQWQPTDLYIVVDGFQGAVGDYQLFVDCQGGPLATATPTPTASPTPTNTPTPTATWTPTPTPTPLRHLAYLPVWLHVFPEPTPTPTITPTPTPTPIVTRVILQNGASGYNGTVDTFLNAWAPDTNYGSETQLAVRYDRPPGPTDVMSVLIRFNLSKLPAGASIAGAWLELFAEKRSNNNEVRVAAYPVLRPWLENQATWNRPRVGEQWQQPGCNDPTVDCSDTPLDTVTVNALNGWYRWDVTAAARAWVANPDSNWGIKLEGLAGFDNANVEYDFTSSESSVVKHRPRLIIDYWVAP